MEPRWAQVIDAEIVRKVTEWLLPGLACPCCGTVTFAAPPAGAHPGAVSYGPVLNAAAVLLSCYGNVPPERAAQLIGMLLGTEVSACWVDKAAARVSAQLGKAGFDDAMLAALAAEDVLAADETPVSVLDGTAPPAPRREKRRKRGKGAGQGPGGEAGEGRGRGAARADHPDPGRAADVPAGHGLAAEGRSRGRAPGHVHRVPDHRRLHRLPASSSFPAGGHPAMRSPRDTPVPGSHELGPGGVQDWARDVITILRRLIRPSRPPAPAGTPPWTSRSSMTCGNATTMRSRPDHPQPAAGLGRRREPPRLRPRHLAGERRNRSSCSPALRRQLDE